MNFLMKKYGSILDIPRHIWGMSDEEILENTDGCGSKWNEIFVPDHWCDIDVKPVCRIHDLDYGYGGNDSARYNADRRFKKNLKITVNAYYKKKHKLSWWRVVTGWFRGRRHQMRLNLAEVYYWFVRKFGASSFNYSEDYKHKD